MSSCIKRRRGDRADDRQVLSLPSSRGTREGMGETTGFIVIPLLVDSWCLPIRHHPTSPYITLASINGEHDYSLKHPSSCTSLHPAPSGSDPYQPLLSSVTKLRPRQLAERTEKPPLRSSNAPDHELKSCTRIVLQWRSRQKELGDGILGGSWIEEWYQAWDWVWDWWSERSWSMSVYIERRWGSNIDWWKTWIVSDVDTQTRTYTIIMSRILKSRNLLIKALVAMSCCLRAAISSSCSAYQLYIRYR